MEIAPRRGSSARLSAELLSLIEALNKSRGEWIFSGTILRDGEESKFEANMNVQGGFRRMIRKGSFPQWPITTEWLNFQVPSARKFP